jgi:hypothetical protein
VNDHLADELLSALIDAQLSRDEESAAHAHLGACAECQARLQELRSVVVLLHALPSIEPPREFSLGPRLVADPPNVIRLQRWYTVARAGAASLAAAFVFLSVGTLYVDSRPVPTSATLSSKAVAPQVASDGVSAPNAPTAENAVVPTAQAPAARQAVPAAAQAPAPAAAQPAAAGAALAAKPTPAAADPADLVTAATSTRPLPTLVPTPLPTPLPVVGVPVSEPQADTAGPLRAAAAIVGVLTVFALLAAVLMRHRLRAAHLQTE